MKAQEALEKSESGRIIIKGHKNRYAYLDEGNPKLLRWSLDKITGTGLDLAFGVVGFEYIHRDDWQPYKGEKECGCVWCETRNNADNQIPYVVGLILQELCKRDKEKG